MKNGNTSIGMCGLIKRDTLDHVDIGFAFLPEFAGMGYAYEIASATMNHAKNKLGIDPVVAITTTDNTRSITLLNRIGLGFERMTRLGDDEEELMLFSSASS